MLSGPATPATAAIAEVELDAFIRASYTKYEHRIEMRDGERLFTAVYVPKDQSRLYGIMLMRTPYGVAPYGVDRLREGLGPSERFAREGFIFAYQDVRGRFLSEGEFEDASPHRVTKNDRGVDESTDTWDTIAWLTANVEGNNGKVGMWGISYPGFFVAAGMIDAHPGLVAASPQAPVTDLYMGDDAYHGGAFFLASNFRFTSTFTRHEKPTTQGRGKPFDYGTVDGYEFFLGLGSLSQVDALHFHGESPFWTAMLEHTTYDEYWQARDISRHLRRTPPAVMTVGGWFDAQDPAGIFKIFRAIEKQAPGTSNHLVVGPWSHGGWSRGDGDRLGDVRFLAETSEFYREEIEFPFFDRELNGAEHEDLPRVLVFETGTHRWRRFESWPPPSAVARKLHFRARGGLGFMPSQEADAADEYTSDPARPVPFVNRPVVGVPKEYMVSDQRFASKRPDVLVYETEPLAEDLTVVGPVSPELYVTTSGSDADFVIKLIDVYPEDFPDNDPNPSDVRMGGYQQLVRGAPFRAKFRSSFEKPEPMVPGELTRIAWTTPDVCHTFRTGHKIMVQVQSSWFPLVDRNPQTFVDIPNARPEDFQPARHQVSRSKGASSSVGILVLDRSQ